MGNIRYVWLAILCHLVLGGHMEPRSTPRHDYPSLTIWIRLYHGAVLEYWNFFAPSYLIFWPRRWKTDIVLVFDEETPQDHHGANVLASLPPYPRVELEAPPPQGTLCDAFRRDGYARQQFSGFYADNYTNNTFIGIVDTDAYLLAPVEVSDLFKLGHHGPIPRVIGYNGCCSSWDHSVKFALGLDSVAEFMYGVGFPITVNRSHLADVREHVCKHLGTHTFEEAFGQICRETKQFSQFGIIWNHLWHFKREYYDWHLLDHNKSHHADFHSRKTSSPEVLARDIPKAGVMHHGNGHYGNHNHIKSNQIKSIIATKIHTNKMVQYCH